MEEELGTKMGSELEEDSYDEPIIDNTIKRIKI